MADLFTGGAASDRAPPPTRDGNAVTLRVNQQDFTGWQAIRITRRLMGCPSDFSLELTERFPTRADAVFVEAGQWCQVLIGNDVVLSGYIDRYSANVSPRGHQVQVVGRSNCQDIVDSHITGEQLSGQQMITLSLLELARRLCAPYGITVKSLTGDNVPVAAPFTTAVPLQFNAILTESPWEIIERVARYAGVLVYDDADGNLVIANVGTSSMASGFQQGVNMQEASVTYAMDGRFSDYLPCLMSVNFFGTDVGGQSFERVKDKDVSALTRADGTPRFRQRIIVSEQTVPGGYLAERRAQWEAVRRKGSSQAVRLTCDRWRDTAGTLWQPNAFASIIVPALKLTPPDPWIIGEVTYAIDLERGTVADLVLMPKDAFVPEPIILTDSIFDPTATDANHGGASAIEAPPWG